MQCSDCFPITPIEDMGTVKIRRAPPVLASVIQAAGYTLNDLNNTGYEIPYASREQFMAVMKLLEKSPVTERTAVCVTGTGVSGFFERWVSLEQLKARVFNQTMVDIISNQEFCSYMQPIVDSAEQIIGFEFLLRPLPHGLEFQPHTLFEVARRSGFHTYLDRAARRSAIESSARHLPDGIKRFVNFLPSSIYNPKYCLTHTFQTIEEQGLRPEDFVFEVVETEKIRDIDHLARIFSEYREHGVHVAMDDVGSGYATLEVMSRLQPDYVKIDRGMISMCDQASHKQALIREVVEKAGRFGGKVLAEGIERREEFEFCLDNGIELAQGYLFGRPELEPPARFFES
ncbi:EAL domain-containing protein [Paenibacillus apii]|uniref:EAL domain-containing protein n=1 Tax=Paenibacillus apii TaxID=1850370 RepID=UPI00143A5379|nr:EAL domain-containing protein [Paenibacillus apii]NJJ38459.1 EAL domain-containing protein [Paenibacillus apii]